MCDKRDGAAYEHTYNGSMMLEVPVRHTWLFSSPTPRHDRLEP